jgi:carboxypeptidase family protein
VTRPKILEGADSGATRYERAVCLITLTYLQSAVSLRMKTRLGFLLAIVLSLVVASPALCAIIVGVVNDIDGKPVTQVKITAVNQSGKQVGESTSDAYGRYCIGPLDPGQYTLKLDPRHTGFVAGDGVADLGEEGLTVDWATSTQAPALATFNLRVASSATAACGGPWWTAAAFAAGAAIGSGVTAMILNPGEEPSPPPPVTGSK